MRNITLCILLLFSTISVFSQKDKKNYDEAFKIIEVWLEAQKDFELLPGISAVIVKDQDILWSGAFGKSNVEDDVDATASTLCSICSISKLFTSVAIMKLYDDGKLRLDDELKDVLPWFSLKQQYPDSGPITIRSLLTHSSGLPRQSEVGGLNVYYRNNVYYRCDGYINIYNRAYVYRPWHRYYAIPSINLCIINVNPYRQYYAPVRHIYYRPYRNNVRYYNMNGRRGNTKVARRNTTNRAIYAQSPRNKKERSIRTRVQRNNATIASTRTTRLSENNSASTRATNGTRSSTTTRTSIRRVNDKGTTSRGSNTRVNAPNTTTRSNRETRAISRTNNSTRSTPRTNTRVATPNRSQSTKTVSPQRSTRKNVTKTPSSVSNKVKTRKSTSVRKPKTTNSRTYEKAKSQNTRQRGVTQNKRKSSSTKARSNTSRKSNQSSTRSGSRRSRG